MNGYILDISFGLETQDNSTSLKTSDGIDVCNTNISNNINLYQWGRTPGDIHISYSPQKSLLILSGYISEFSNSSSCSSQQELIDQIRLRFDDNLSEAGVCSLASSIHGSFALLYVSLKELKIWSLSDRLCSRPQWYHYINGNLRVSSHAIAIAKHINEKRFTPSGLVSYLLYATQVDPTSCIFPNILCQKEGTLLQFAPGGVRKETRWYLFQHRPDYSRTLSNWADIASDLFVKAAARILKTTARPLLFLSGGVDSRIAGAAIVAAGGSPILCTLGDSNNLEIKIAKIVAQALHCPHEIILRDDEWYLRVISRAMFNSHGMYSWNHSHFSEAYARLQTVYNVDAAILGDFCEVFSKLFCSPRPGQQNTLWKNNEFLAEFDKLPLQNYRPLNRATTLGLLCKDIQQEALKSLEQCISERFSQLSVVSTDPLIVGDYFFRSQTASCLPTFQMLNDVRSVGPERNLMFDKDLHQLLEIMPSAIRNQVDLGSKIVNRLCPVAAWVPNANSLIPLPFPSPIHSFAKSVRPKLGKLRRLLFSNTYQTTASWPHLPLLYAGHTAWKNQIEERLHDNSLLPKELFDHEAITTCWQDFCAGDFSRHADVERLFGLSELMRLLR